MSEYVFKRLTKESITELHWLFKAALKTSPNLNEFRKKYNTDYTGVSYIGYLAIDQDNNPAAFYGVLPELVLINAKPVLIAQSADTLTHPNHQRKGLFIKLALMTYELAKAEGVNFIYGIPNENSYPGFVTKLNWTHSGNMQKFEFKIPMLPFSQLFRNNTFLKSFYQAYVKFILLFVKNVKIGFPNPNIGNNDFGTFRNDDLFTYKKYSKKHLVKIKGAKVWLKFEGSLKIGDIELSGNTDLKSIIKRLKLIAFLTGIQKIQYQCNSKSECFSSFSKLCEPIEAMPVIYLNLTNLYSPEQLVLSLADFDTF